MAEEQVQELVGRQLCSLEIAGGHVELRFGRLGMRVFGPLFVRHGAARLLVPEPGALRALQSLLGRCVRAVEIVDGARLRLVFGPDRVVAIPLADASPARRSVRLEREDGTAVEL